MWVIQRHQVPDYPLWMLPALLLVGAFAGGVMEWQILPCVGVSAPGRLAPAARGTLLFWTCMPTRSPTTSVSLPGSPDSVFAALHTPCAIRPWRHASRVIVIPEPDGVGMAACGAEENEPDYVTAARWVVFAPPRRLVLGDYKYRSGNGGLPFRADFTVEVDRSPAGCTLRVTQDRFPADAEADAFYHACERGWRDTLAGIERFCPK